MPSLCSASATKPARRGERTSSAGVALDQAARIEIAVDRGVDGCVRIERAQPRGQAFDAPPLGEIGFRDHQPVGEDGLLARFRRPLQGVEAGGGVDHGDHHLGMEFRAQRAVGGEGLQDRAGIGQPAGLDQDPLELRHRALRALGHQIAQRHLQVGAGVAAQAAVAEQRHLIARSAHQRVVDADTAELVDDHGGPRALGCSQEAPHQRGLAGAEKAGDDGHRNARAAGTLEPSPERAGIARGEEIKHGL